MVPRNRPGIGAALARTTEAFAATGRPAPSTLAGQIWAALTRSTPAFRRAAQPEAVSATSARERQLGLSSSLESQQYLLGGSALTSGFGLGAVKVHPVGSSEPDESLRLLAEAVRELSVQLANFMAGSERLANEAREQVAALRSLSAEMLGAALQATRVQADSVQGISALVQALSKLNDSGDDLGESVRWLVDRQKREERVREEMRAEDDNGRQPRGPRDPRETGADPDLLGPLHEPHQFTARLAAIKTRMDTGVISREEAEQELHRFQQRLMSESIRLGSELEEISRLAHAEPREAENS